jgi:hypothetical protein
MHFLAMSAVDVAGAGIEGVFGGVVGHVVHMTGDELVVRVADQRRIRQRALLLELRVLAEGIRQLHRLAVVGGVVDVHRHRAAEHVAVVPPHEHLLAIHVETVLAIERMEIPAGRFRIDGIVRPVVAAVRPFHDDLAMRLQIVRAEEEAVECREEHVPVLQDDAEGDVLRLGELCAMRPGFAVVLRQHDLRALKREGLAVALRVDVRLIRRRHAIPEVLGLAFNGGGGERLVETREPEPSGGGSRAAEKLTTMD